MDNLVDFNNIYITHNGVRVSVIQHRDADPTATKYQEVGIGETSDDTPIIRYGSTLTELIDALQEAQSRIDYESDKEFIEFIKYTLVPDLKESGYTSTAQDFNRLLKIIGEK